MKRIEFTTNNSVGYLELPDDVKSIKVPSGICVNCEETEPLEYDTGINVPAEQNTDHKITIPGGEDDGEHLLPNIQ